MGYPRLPSSSVGRLDTSYNEARRLFQLLESSDPERTVITIIFSIQNFTFRILSDEVMGGVRINLAKLDNAVCWDGSGCDAFRDARRRR